MKLFHVSQNENNDYDSYSDMVVIAPDAETARDMSPRTGEILIWSNRFNAHNIYNFAFWATKRENVIVKYLGEADPSFTKSGVICASFHAG